MHASERARRDAALIAALAASLVGVLSLNASCAVAAETEPQWTVTSVSSPTNLEPGDNSGEDSYRVFLTNTGAAVAGCTDAQHESEQAMHNEEVIKLEPVEPVLCPAGSPMVNPVKITDELPPGLALDAKGASGEDVLTERSSNFTCTFRTCTYSGRVVPGQTLVLTFPIDISAGPFADTCEAPAGALGCLINVVRVSGGGALAASTTTPTVISGSAASFDISPGASSTALSSVQAGAHPDITTSIAFNTVGALGTLAGDPKDLVTDEPAGFALDLVDTPSCSPAQLSLAACPPATQVGVTTLAFDLEGRKTVSTVQPVYNLTPNAGEVGKLGFTVAGNFNIQGNISLRPGDYGGTVAFHDTNEHAVELDDLSLTLWGVPADAIHNPLRFVNPIPGLNGGHFGAVSEGSHVPFFTNPTSCGSEPLQATFAVTSWQHPNPSESLEPTRMPFGPIVGCDRLGMEPSLTAEVSTDKASAATGFNLATAIPQTYDNPDGLATSTLKREVVTLPEGMTVNPSAGAGLAACTPAQFAEEAVQSVPGKGCPNESKLATVKILTPALKEEATGSVFLAQPAPFGEPGHNPFNSLLALYLIARIPNRGVLIASPGLVEPNLQTGRLITTFDNLPPLPFSLATFSFNQGANAPLVTPPTCRSYTVQAQLTPYSDPAQVLSPAIPAFLISAGFDGGACPVGGAPPFAPRVVAGTQNNAAGSYSPFYLRVIRQDDEQELTGFSTIMPPGLTGNLTGIPFCPDAAVQASREHSGVQEEAEPSCPAASRVGHSLVGAGVGTVLAQTPGSLYLAGPYHGAPLSLVSITSAKVGPFDLGTVVIRFALRVNPATAQVEVDATGSDLIPHIIKGIVVHVRDIRAYIDRPNFIINPTNCEHLTINNVVTGAGADPSNPADQVPVSVNSPFQTAECANLAFKPVFKVLTSGNTSKANGASLTVKLTVPGVLGSESNIKQVKVELPKQLPSRLTTLQRACTKAQFDINPAGCPAASVVGHARAITPILPVPLEGPAYFVSNGSEAFPNLIVVLQGYGITIDLVGDTFISKAGITSSTFKTVPDQPVTSFELTLPQGPYSALAANGNLCSLTRTVTIRKRVTVRVRGHRKTMTRKVKKTVAASLTMPTEFVAQNGMIIHQSAPIGVTGCLKGKKAKRGRTTRARRGKR